MYIQKLFHLLIINQYNEQNISKTKDLLPTMSYYRAPEKNQLDKNGYILSCCLYLS